MYRDLNIFRDTIVASYDAFYDSASQLRDTDAFYRWVLDKLAPTPGHRLLDVACGEGHLVKFARQRGLQGVGIDFSSNAASLARGIVASEVIAIADGEILPFVNENFDYVTNLGSLEHFLNPLLGVQEICRVLRPEGRAALLLPNSYYLVDIIWHVWRTGYSVSHRQIVERFATFCEWRDFLEQGGLSVRRVYKYNLCFPRSRSDWRWYKQHPWKLLCLLVAPFVPFNLSYSFLYICTKDSRADNTMNPDEIMAPIRQTGLTARLDQATGKFRQLAEKHWLRLSVQVLILTCCLIYLVANLRSVQGLTTDLRINFALLVAAWALAIVAVFLGALGWWLTLRGLGQQVGWFPSACAHVFSNLVKYIPGYAWQLMGKAYLTRQIGLASGTVGLGMMVELIQLILTGLGVATSLVPATLVVEYTGRQTVIVYIRLVGLAAFFALGLLPFLMPLALRRTRHYHTIDRVKPVVLWGATLALLAGWLLLGFSFWLLGMALKPLPLSEVPLFIFTLVSSFLIGLAVVIIPGSIGVRESIMVLILGVHMPGSLVVFLASLSRLVWTLSELTGSLILKGLLWRKSARTAIDRV